MWRRSAADQPGRGPSGVGSDRDAGLATFCEQEPRPTREAMQPMKEPEPQGSHDGPAGGDGLIFVAHPNAALEDLQALVAEVAAPAVGETVGLFPSTPYEGDCRICGQWASLTEEHLPPRGAFNKGRGRTPELMDMLGSDTVDFPGSGPTEQGGICGYTLCLDCNNFSGTRWGREYQEWARRAAQALTTVPGGIAAVDSQAVYPGWEPLIFKGVFPGRFVRQVLAMMLTISGSAELGERYGALRRLVLGGDPEPLPDPLRLYVSVFAGPLARIAGGPNGQLWANLESRVARRLLAVDFPPLASVLLLDGPEAPELGVDISTFAETAPDRRMDVTFEVMPLGFGYKPWPTDYRTRGRIIADAIDSET